MGGEFLPTDILSSSLGPLAIIASLPILLCVRFVFSFAWAMMEDFLASIHASNEFFRIVLPVIPGSHMQQTINPTSSVSALLERGDLINRIVP